MPPMVTDRQVQPDICEVTRFQGTEAPQGQTADLLIEVPHGATRRSDYEALFQSLEGPFPEGLIDFFFVNTDVGAPEVGRAWAEHVIAESPHRSVALIRSLIPRTFIDCNRVIDVDTRAAESAPGAVTPGLLPYVTSEKDRALLFERYSAYQTRVSALIDEVSKAGGLTVMLHSYAPRTVDVAVDADIVARLREAYRPEKVESWPLRPEVDLIHATPEGESLVDEKLLTLVQEKLTQSGIQVASADTYSLVPGTMARVYTDRYPRQTFCLEIRRDLLADPFMPFEEMNIAPDRADRVARPLAAAVRAWWGD